MLNRIKHYFTLDCVIFTIMTVVLSIVYYFATWDSTVKTITAEGLFKTFGTMVFSYFTVTTVMSFLFMILEIVMLRIFMKLHLTIRRKYEKINKKYN